MLRTERRRSSQDGRSDEASLRTRVKELEREVVTLKKRLDELRKAKNTTVLKREREVLEVGVPFTKRETKPVHPGDQKMDELQKKLDQLKLDREKEMAEIRNKFAADVEELKKQNTSLDCGHERELASLRERVCALEAENAAVLLENAECKEQLGGLVTELSVKEAHWCEMEEKYKLELKTSWGAKYAEWMSATERKIQDLQATNEILRGYLKMHAPEGRDPSGQDPA
ncbi:kinesin-like protein KIF3A [Liolophura sinensis]|uniref:kinesin-like protein KIF3A n=1 Tax=Liolophura sinensis TaxID=3198878 RepID=UPI0031597B0E